MLKPPENRIDGFRCLPGADYRFAVIHRDFTVVLRHEIPEKPDSPPVLITQPESERIKARRKEDSCRDVEFCFEADSLECASLHDFPFFVVDDYAAPKGPSGARSKRTFWKIRSWMEEDFSKSRVPGLRLVLDGSTFAELISTTKGKLWDSFRMIVLLYPVLFPGYIKKAIFVPRIEK